MGEGVNSKKDQLIFCPEKLILFRGIGNHPLIKKTKELLTIVNGEPENALQREPAFYHICSQLVQMAEKNHWTGDLWRSFITFLIAQDENAFSRASAWSERGKPASGLLQLAAHDMKYLKLILSLDFRNIGEWVPIDVVDILSNFSCYYFSGQTINRGYLENVAALQENLRTADSPEELAEALGDFYRLAGCGKMGLFSSFRWEGEKGLTGIPYPDPVALGDLIGCENQKETVIKNTEAFLRGKKANNALLYGERGTGKSSTVKALVNEYFNRGLRLLEVNKSQFDRLQEIMRVLREYPQRFLLFIDDLSFESNETEYKYLKYILEGGMEVLPDNVLIYATSNRRHLVQENWHDRERGGEVRIHDSQSEKLSLSDRFGITVTYMSPDQDEYLNIVVGLAHKNGVDMPPEELKERALQWERWHNCRSGRTAKQFINSLS